MGVSDMTSGELGPRWLRGMGARSVVLASAAVTSVLSALALVPGLPDIFFDDLQELTAAGGSALALLIAGRRNERPGRGLTLAMAAALGSAFVGMIAWDLSHDLGEWLSSAGNVVFVGGAILGVATIARAIFGSVSRESLTGVLIDTLIVFLAGVAVVAAFWQQSMVGPKDRVASMGAVFLVAAAASSAFGLFSRGIGWSAPGPWILLLGGLVLGTSWLMWAGGLASPSTVDVWDFTFSAGLLLIAYGVLGWDTSPSSGPAFERLGTVLGSLLPVGAIFGSLALFAVLRESNSADLLAVAVAAVIVTSAIRQLHLFSRETRARRAVATRTAELQSAMSALELEIGERQRLEDEREAMQVRMAENQRLESIGRLAGGIAHDFNNLLTAIRGYADLAALRLPAGDEAHEDIAALRHATDQAADLTAQLLAFSRNQRLRPSVVNLNEVVSRAEPLLRRLIGEHVQLEIRPQADLRPVLADASQIESIIVNLAVNARDAMESGGRLVIETRNVELDDRSDIVQAEVVPGSYAMVSVADTGAGMNEATLSHIFEPFFTTKETGKGTGLGLAVVYGTIRQSGGYIGVTSAPGQGTTFRIYLPATNQARPAGEDRQVAARSHRVGRETILVVEDEAPVRAMIAAALRRWGYSVVAVRDGEEAMAEVERGTDFGVLLTDIVMPGTSGLDLADKVLSRCPNVRVICMSGYTPPSIGRALDPQVRFLAKPFTLGKLEQLMRDVLGD
jgi:signal transduction histidine kinase/CheY-like chemotaxis protein